MQVRKDLIDVEIDLSFDIIKSMSKMNSNRNLLNRLNQTKSTKPKPTLPAQTYQTEKDKFKVALSLAQLSPSLFTTLLRQKLFRTSLKYS